MMFNFDTLAAFDALKEDSFSEEQARGLLSLLEDRDSNICKKIKDLENRIIQLERNPNK